MIHGEGRVNTKCRRAMSFANALRRVSPAARATAFAGNIGRLLMLSSRYKPPFLRMGCGDAFVVAMRRAARRVQVLWRAGGNSFSRLIG